MIETEKAPASVASMDEIQQGWHDFTARVTQLEAEKDALEQENKALRFLLERVVEHRQKSHGELVLLLTSLVSKLPINDVGTIVARLMEHNTHVSEVCAVLAKGKADAPIPQPQVLRALDQTKRDLAAALKLAVEELIKLDTPLERQMLELLVADPEEFFSQKVVRANRCFIKGQVMRERVIREFGESALIFFNDVTTDPKLNPRPKPEEIALAFRTDFEPLFQQNAGALPDKGQGLWALYQRVQRSKAATDEARAQRNAFLTMSFILELLHYYENQSTEAPDVVFAQRLPALIEQLVVAGGPQDNLDEKLIAQAERLLAFIISTDHRLMVINNLGKVSAVGKTLRYVLALRSDKLNQPDQVIAEFVKYLIPQKKSPNPEVLAAVLRIVKPEMQRFVVEAIMNCDRLPLQQVNALGKAVGNQLGLTGLEAPKKTAEAIPPEMERQMAWERIKDLISRRTDPGEIATAFRDRLHAKYDADELKQSWITLTEADPISLIRVFLPFAVPGRRQDGSGGAGRDGNLHQPPHTREVRQHVSQSREQPAKHVQGKSKQPNARQFHGAGKMGGPGSGKQIIGGRGNTGNRVK